MKKLLLITLALLAAGALHADTIVQTHNIETHGPGSDVSPWTDSWSFDKFNTVSGTRVLNSVQIVFNIQAWGGWLGADNDSETSAASGEVSQDVTGKLTSDLALVNSSFANVWASILARNQATFNLTVDDGSDPDTAYDEGGTDWDRLDGPTEANAISITAEDYILDGDAENEYLGSGTFDMAFASDQDRNAFSEGYVSGGFGPQQASGLVTITYDYTVVPEPATASMMLFVGGLGFLIRRHFIS